MKNTERKNVYELTQERLKFIFDEFDNIYVSFSGGKDSTVLLNLCIDYIRKHHLKRRLGVFHLDYEVQYEMTTRFVEETLKKNSDILDVYHICVPFKVTTCCSMHQLYWRPWDEEMENLWVRPMPKDAYTKKDFPFFREDLWDYDFQFLFSEWIHKRVDAVRTACLVGIRTQESLDRWRAIHSSRRYNTYHSLTWSNRMAPDVFNFYPIYDWRTEDVWTATARNEWDYNPLYELYYKAGVPIDRQRVASPFLSAAQDTLKLYRVIDPNTWGRMVGRVNGVNFTGIYGGTRAMGWQSITLPEGYTWEKYLYFLLDTLPPETRASYLAKLDVSRRFWRTRGGCLSKETIQRLKDLNIPIEVQHTTNYKTEKLPVRMDYIDDINIPEFREIPTYKRMCICILKNDHICKYMGFALTKNEKARIDEVMAKYKDIIK
jgi:predicted phosphoadenosine phosphosulfate sulfurtransferase